MSAVEDTLVKAVGAVMGRVHPHGFIVIGLKSPLEKVGEDEEYVTAGTNIQVISSLQPRIVIGVLEAARKSIEDRAG